MKTIYIVRHAKSSWEIRDLPDEKRPLLEKGITRTKKIARELKRQEVVIDHILCSSAVRSLETAKLLAEGLKIPGQSIEIIPEIYEADSCRVIEILSALPDNIQSLALVGHNPSVTDLVNLFISLPLESLPTSGVVSISFNISKWIDLNLASHHVNFILIPDKLP